jgi:hypothetical protein
MALCTRLGWKRLVNDQHSSLLVRCVADEEKPVAAGFIDEPSLRPSPDGCHDTQHNDTQRNDIQHNGICAVMLSVAKKPFMLSVAKKPFMLSVVMINGIILSVVMLNVVAPPNVIKLFVP